MIYARVLLAAFVVLAVIYYVMVICVFHSTIGWCLRKRRNK